MRHNDADWDCLVLDGCQSCAYALHVPTQHLGTVAAYNAHLGKLGMLLKVTYIRERLC